MKNYSVFDDAFREYGKILYYFDTDILLQKMKAIPMPENGVCYEASIADLEDTEVFAALRDRAFGGMPIQIGLCWGFNTKLNCLEYHRDSEINVGVGDFVLLLAKIDQIQDGQLDTSNVKAFYVPAGTVVEVYATSLHYAPCQLNTGDGFRVAVVLPKGTNTAPPDLKERLDEDIRMTARNKWLLAHPDSQEASEGAYVGLTGINIDIAK